MTSLRVGTYKYCALQGKQGHGESEKRMTMRTGWAINGSYSVVLNEEARTRSGLEFPPFGICQVDGVPMNKNGNN